MEQDGVKDSHLTLIERQSWSGRINRGRLPERFRDELPQPTPPVSSPPAPEIHQGARSSPRIQRIFTSAKNAFGLFRRYQSARPPTHDPDVHLTADDLSNIPPAQAFPRAVSPTDFFPYPNRSAFALGDWFWNGGVNKSQASFDSLMDIISDENFSIDDVRDVNWDRVNKELGAEDAGEWLDEDAGWTSTPVSILVPFQPRRGVPSPLGACARNYTVGEFRHRKLVSVIKEKITGLEATHQFRFEPYELLWHPPHLPEPVRVQGELYNSPAFLDAHQDLQNSPGEPDCDLPRVVAALMYFSDATHLTAFGNAKLWPLYQFFGNDSKYPRCKPTSHLCEHVAYFLTVRISSLVFNDFTHRFLSKHQLPDAFQDFASTQVGGGRAPTAAFTTQCHRELMHEQWKILLDDEFLEAWEHGIILRCPDGILRRFYPRIFTYSADYPEK